LFADLDEYLAVTRSYQNASPVNLVDVVLERAKKPRVAEATRKGPASGSDAFSPAAFSFGEYRVHPPKDLRESVTGQPATFLKRLFFNADDISKGKGLNHIGHRKVLVHVNASGLTGIGVHQLHSWQGAGEHPSSDAYTFHFHPLDMSLLHIRGLPLLPQAGNLGNGLVIRN